MAPGSHVARLSLLAIATVLAGCGGGGSDTGSSTGEGSAGTTAAASGPSPATVCARVPVKRVQSIVDRASGGSAPTIHASADGTSQLVKCSYKARGADVDLNLDLAPNSNQRFDNRVVEMTQFSTNRPSTRPRPVNRVGDPRSGDNGAQWIPALDQLLAFRPGRYLIVDFTAHSAPDAANRAGAAALARLAFPVLPRAQGAGSQRPTPGG